jgi:hypothetical protein
MVMEAAAATADATGVVPTFAELVGLRALADGRRPARRGASGVQGHALSSTPNRASMRVAMMPATSIGA